MKYELFVAFTSLRYLMYKALLHVPFQSQCEIETIELVTWNFAFLIRLYAFKFIRSGMNEKLALNQVRFLFQYLLYLGKSETDYNNQPTVNIKQMNLNIH